LAALRPGERLWGRFEREASGEPRQMAALGVFELPPAKATRPSEPSGGPELGQAQPSNLGPSASQDAGASAEPDGRHSQNWRRHRRPFGAHD